VVDCPSDRIRETTEALFVDLADDSPTDELLVVSVDSDAATGRTTISVGDASGQPPRPDFSLANLVTAVSRLALDTDPTRLHLHCAALASNGRGVLVSAPSGTGKSTLAAAMIHQGWTYVSDEAVALEPGVISATGFAKPLILDARGAELVPELNAGCVSIDGSDQEWSVPASALGAAVATELEPVAIVILHRSPDGDTGSPSVATPLHAADAVVALMGQTMDAQRFGPDAVSVLAHIAARGRCVSMNVGPLDGAVSLLTDLVGSEVVPSSVRSFPPCRPSTDAEHPDWSVPAEVRSVLIDDRVVVHDTLGGAIVALDEAGTAVWQALHGDAPGWWQPDVMRQASTVSFLEQLAALGLVANVVADWSTHR
jgi:hypothetical protein